MSRPAPCKQLLFGSFLLLVLAPAGCGRGKQATEEPEEPPAPVKAVRAHRTVLEGWTELLGATQPLPSAAVRVTAAVEGQVLPPDAEQEDPVREGERVRAGRVLLRLDD